jgi:hypothetical protein
VGHLQCSIHAGGGRSGGDRMWAEGAGVGHLQCSVLAGGGRSARGRTWAEGSGVGHLKCSIVAGGGRSADGWTSKLHRKSFPTSILSLYVRASLALTRFSPLRCTALRWM